MIMAFGDTGGSVTELIITCRTPLAGGVAIGKGDVVKLSGAYTVTNVTDAEDVIFGEAMAAATENDVAIPVKVRGISIFPYTDGAPLVNGVQGVVASATDGSVKAPAAGDGRGINVKVDAAATLVHVLL
jgi:hypothetical protein